MPVLTVITTYPIPNGPAVFTGLRFLTQEILMEVLLKEFERVEQCNFRCFIAKKFELPDSKENIN